MQPWKTTTLLLILLHIASADLLSCCTHAKTDNICHGSCTNIFTAVSDLHLSSSQFQDLTLACPSSYYQLWACINQTTVSPVAMGDLSPTEVTQITTPANYYCCDRGQEEECRETCRRELASSDPTVAIGRVSEACGPPPTGPLWECFFAPTTEPPNLEPVNVDWARIQCCNHASARVCRDSCVQLYSGIISTFSWQTLQLDCIHRSSEASLITCLNDVSFPCKLGCSKLHFCSNFNNRPTTSFRQCTPAADRMAKNEYYTWAHHRHINHPLTTVLLKDIEACHPALWKALACTIHVQPCHPVTHATQICREDCIQLLSDCSNSTYSATAICDIITPASSNENCISLSEYTKSSKNSEYQVSLVTNPCDPNPCKEGFFCSINHLCRHGDLACSHYTCQPGCSVGDSPSLVYPRGSRIKVPVELLSSKDECFGYFNCTVPSASGEAQVIPGSSPAPPSVYCEHQLHCFIGEDIYPHLDHFQPDDCNFCTCFYGRIKCTNLSCKATEDSSTYMNCNCSRVYQPVCTRDGHTLPNTCTANCLGYEKDDYRIGDCNTFDPCSGHSCSEGSKCMPNRRVCLQGNLGECTQHTCEPLQQTCNSLADPVCDASNSQHSMLCDFLRTQEEFGYHGYCREECSRIKARPVCGVNGETFKTSCHAESMHIAIDYEGPCTAVPGSGPKGSCSGVVCPSLSHSTCTGVRPWSACCPKCGGYVSILMDEDSLSINANALGLEVVSSIDIIRRLRHYITSMQCDLYGFVAADRSLSVLVLPVLNSSAPVVGSLCEYEYLEGIDNVYNAFHSIEACNQEAVKLATLINNQTPLLASDPLLSHLIAARAETSHTAVDNQSRDETGGVVNSSSAHKSGLSLSVSFFVTFCVLSLF